MDLHLILMMSSQIVSCTPLKKRTEKHESLSFSKIQHSKTAGLCNMWYRASWEIWFSLLKNGSVGAKPVISFTEGRMSLFGRQSGFSTFTSMMCCYSSIGMDVVEQPGLCLQSPQSHWSEIEGEQCDHHSLAQTEVYFSELRKAW